MFATIAAHEPAIPVSRPGMFSSYESSFPSNMFGVLFLGRVTSKRWRD